MSTAVVIGGAGVAALPTLATAADCALVPQLREAAVNQGISQSPVSTPAYTPLVRKKTTVVKAYLAKPACATDADRIKITGARMTMQFPGKGLLPVTDTFTVSSITGPDFPEVLSALAAPSPNAPADPVFTVPGSFLDGSSQRDSRVSVPFTISVDYTATSVTGAVTNGSTTLKKDTISSSTVTAQFERATNSVKLLFVPMGVPTQVSTWWPSTTSTTPGAEAQLLKAAQALVRTMPLPDGVATLASGTAAGLRYAIEPNVVDVSSAIGTDGKFCGNDLNFSALRTKLQQTYTAWQSRNGAKTVDKVVGVVVGAKSKGPVEDRNCAAGFASVGGTYSWTRLVPDTATAKGSTGPLLTMEVGHNIGNVPLTRSVDYHSVPESASGGRGVNTLTRAVLTDAPSALNFQTGSAWNDYETLLRAEDFNYTLCRLNPGATASSCPAEPGTPTGTIGVPGGLATVYALAGTSDGTRVGSSIHSYVSESTDTTTPVQSSVYRLLQRSGANGSVLADEGVPVLFKESEHHGEAESDQAAARGSFEVRFAIRPGADRFQLVKGTTVLYERVRDGAPVFGPVGVVPSLEDLVNRTADLAQGGSDAALSADRGALAHSTAGSLVLQDLGTGARTLTGVAGTDPTWIGDDRLAWLSQGDLYTAPVTRAGTAPTLGESRLVYDSARSLPVLAAPAGAPTVDAAGSTMVVAIAGDLWRIDLAAALLAPGAVVCALEALPVAPCRRITTSEDVDAEPAFDGASRLLFTRGGAVRALAVGTGAVEAASLAGSAPAPSGALTAYTDGTGLSVANTAALTKTTRLTTAADDDASLSGTGLAFERTSGGRTDVITTGIGRYSIEFTATDATALLADVFVRCEGVETPIFVAEPGEQVSGQTYSWQLAWDSSLACADAVVVARVTDGYDTTVTEIGTVRGGRGTSAAVYSPAPGAVVPQYDIVPLAGDVEAEDELAEPVWRVVGPGYDETFPYTPGEVRLVQPPAGGWQDGATYDVQLVSGEVVLARGGFVGQGDTDHDGQPNAKEALACYPAGAATDPTNASADYDADGEPNIVDDQPCTSASTVSVDLDPSSLFSGSSGNTITVYLSGSKVDLRRIDPSTVALTRLGQVWTDIHQIQWQVASATSAQLKLPRPAVLQVVADHGFRGYVPMIITGSGSSGSLRGVDPVDPIVK